MLISGVRICVLSVVIIWIVLMIILLILLAATLVLLLGCPVVCLGLDNLLWLAYCCFDDCISFFPLVVTVS